MSYSIRLCDPVTKESIDLPFGHIMIGGTYAAEYDASTGHFNPKPIQEAWLSITYNYAHYYFEAAEGDSRFEIQDGDAIDNGGIRGIYMKSGAESVPMLQDLILAAVNEALHQVDTVTEAEMNKVTGGLKIPGM